jgi:DNA (cytosine-5)-methyltransferase 1
VFVVASARKDFDPAKVLFESESVRRDSPPRRETQQNVTSFTPSSFGQYSEGIGTLRAKGGDFGGGSEILTYQDVSHCLNAGGMGRVDYETESFVIHGTQDLFALGRDNGGENVLAFSAKDYLGDVSKNVSPTLRACGSQSSNQNSGHWVAIHENNRSEVRLSDISYTLNTQGGKPGQGYQATYDGQRVRRLTPVECERLQGFPDNYTNVTHRGKPAADGPRYKALGNSKATNCVQWLGVRIILERMGLL